MDVNDLTPEQLELLENNLKKKQLKKVAWGVFKACGYVGLCAGALIGCYTFSTAAFGWLSTSLFGKQES